jgi:uncharacterized phiE125 gp8 family phage protein
MTMEIPGVTSSTLVTLAEAKAHLRVDDTESDDLITAVIYSAQEHVQAMTNLEFTNTTRTLKLDRFPGGKEMWDISEWAPALINEDLMGRIRIKYAPLVSVTSITYYDGDNAQQTLASTNYEVNTWIKPGTIKLAKDGTWPTLYEREDAVTITYVAGFGANTTDVPYQIKQAMLLLIGAWYEFREAIVQGQAPKDIPWGARALLASFTTVERP